MGEVEEETVLRESEEDEEEEEICVRKNVFDFESLFAKANEALGKEEEEEEDEGGPIEHALRMLRYLSSFFCFYFTLFLMETSC